MLKKILEILEEIKRLQSLQKEIYNIDDLCSYTGMSKDYAYHLTSNRKIKFYRPFGKLIFFDAEDVKNFLKQNPVETSNQIEEKSNQYLVKSNNS